MGGTALAEGLEVGNDRGMDVSMAFRLDNLGLACQKRDRDTDGI